MTISTATRVLDALVEGGEIIRKSDKTGRVWYSLSTEGEIVSLAPSGAKSKRARETRIPAGWQADAALREWARGEGCDDALIAAYEAYFVDWATANSKTYTDWAAAFRNCVRGDWGGVRKNFKPGAVKAAMPGVIW